MKKTLFLSILLFCSFVPTFAQSLPVEFNTEFTEAFPKIYKINNSYYLWYYNESNYPIDTFAYYTVLKLDNAFNLVDSRHIPSLGNIYKFLKNVTLANDSVFYLFNIHSHFNLYPPNKLILNSVDTNLNILDQNIYDFEMDYLLSADWWMINDDLYFGAQPPNPFNVDTTLLLKIDEHAQISDTLLFPLPGTYMRFRKFLPVPDTNRFIFFFDDGLSFTYELNNDFNLLGYFYTFWVPQTWTPASYLRFKNDTCISYITSSNQL